MNGSTFRKLYKEKISEFRSWIKENPHAQDFLVFPNNIGRHLSIDETCLSNGELYTILSNKAAKGRKGSIVAIIQGVDATNIITILRENITKSLREQVEEVTLDMSPAMNKIVRKCFQNATRVIDRFHVEKLALEVLQHHRIKHRWNAIDEENDAIKRAKEEGEKYIPSIFINGDTLKQLLARSRYLLFKHWSNWSSSQEKRAQILFDNYPDLKEMYFKIMELNDLMNRALDRSVANLKLAQWFNRVEELEYEGFATLKNTFYTYSSQIVNYFNNRSTNAAAESLNAKIKDLRRKFRGVVDVNFFLFRLTKIYA